MAARGDKGRNDGGGEKKKRKSESTVARASTSNRKKERNRPFKKKKKCSLLNQNEHFLLFLFLFILSPFVHVLLVVVLFCVICVGIFMLIYSSSGWVSFSLPVRSFTVVPIEYLPHFTLLSRSEHHE
jgi:hypothetical protein